MKVIIGAGRTSYDGWLSTQEHELNLLSKESWNRLFEPGGVDALLAEHVWEHLTYEGGDLCCRALL
jgi:predicted SAM-dependent methyltransferase